MNLDESDYLAHYGTPRHSGRYPWGSGGEETDTRNAHFLDHVADMKQQGLSDVEIAKGMGISTTTLRNRKSIAKTEKKQADIAMVERLVEKGYSNVAIGQRMGIPESTVRSYRAPGAKHKADVLSTTTKMLKNEVGTDGLIDVGRGVEQHIGVSTTVLSNAVSVLKDEGYVVLYPKVEQLGTGKLTNQKILAPPGTTYGDYARNKAQVRQVSATSKDMGVTFAEPLPPISIHHDRVGVVYGDQGGSKADGVIYVRPGVTDVSLGNAKYAQVRIKVGDEHYLKGMAMYKDDLPEGTDLLFNTSKKDTGVKTDAFKKIENEDPRNPFGAITDQIKDDKGKVTSTMNLVNEEGDWTEWSRTIAPQVLSKQSPALAKAQLNMTYEDRLAEFKNISALTNPTVKKKLLDSFANETDAASVHLKAAALPKQGWHVLLPMPSIPVGQIYAPNYRNGEPVVLIRYPHGGRFEIPELIVNNNHRPAKSVLGNARDAVAVHPKVAEKLSGADFDGDTVLVIPNTHKKIQHTASLEELKGFDPRASYPKYDGMKVMTAEQKGMEMGKISNLITDMTIRQAPPSEVVRAVKHSMVVIDAEKHELNYKQSFIDNNIPQLKEKYQGGREKGASTLISRAKRKVYLPQTQERRASRGGPIDPTTGRKVLEETGRLNFKSGKPKLQRFKELETVDDANLLSSGTPMEKLYADHSNKLKALANTARLEYLRTPPLKYSPTAKKVYEEEVKSLNSDLALALRNAPLERQAQIIANSMVKARRDADPQMDEATLKKVKAQAQDLARTRMGAKKQQIEITDRQWEAIQAGAISNSKLTQILNNANLDIVKEHAQPHNKVLMTQSKIANAQLLLANGATRSEVAERLGVSVSTLDKAIHSDMDEGDGFSDLLETINDVVQEIVVKGE